MQVERSYVLHFVNDYGAQAVFKASLLAVALREAMGVGEWQTGEEYRGISPAVRTNPEKSGLMPYITLRGKDLSLLDEPLSD